MHAFLVENAISDYLHRRTEERQQLGIYVGFKENKKPAIFESETKPTKETHPQYDFTYGPFKSTEEAQTYISAMNGLACSDG